MPQAKPWPVPSCCSHLGVALGHRYRHRYETNECIAHATWQGRHNGQSGESLLPALSVTAARLLFLFTGANTHGERRILETEEKLLNVNVIPAGVVPPSSLPYWETIKI